MLHVTPSAVLNTPRLFDARTRVGIFGLFLAITIALPAFIHNQWITGPVINACLFLAAALLGPAEAIGLGLMPSAVALSAGLLPLPLAPMVPFIMIGNALLVSVFSSFQTRSFWMGVLLAAFLKFAFLQLSFLWVMRYWFAGEIMTKVQLILSWPQFFTALLGGFIAFFVFRALK